MEQYYTTDLDGSGQIVAVADSGLDHDHGDFGSRIIGNVDVIGDGSTADAHSGHALTLHVRFLEMNQRKLCRNSALSGVIFPSNGE